jgi:hypothetical protein
MSGDEAARHHLVMPHFLIEIHMAAHAKALELERAVRLLEAAQTRIRGTAAAAPMILAGLSHEDDRLVCLVEAPSLEAARRLLSVALLPSGRIREITHLAGTGLPRGRYPGGNVDPGVEPELVEDVVDVGLDGALGEE